MPESSSVTQWIERVQQGRDERAAGRLWERYCQQLARVARKRLRELGARCRAEDEDDAVQEAFRAFFRRVEAGAYPDCHNRDDLWCLLVKIADSKVRQLARGERRRKRGGGKVRGDSVFKAHDGEGGGGFDELPVPAGEVLVPTAPEEPTEEFVDQLVEAVACCYGVQDDVERQVLRGQLQGFTNAEIADQIGCVTRTVERKLKVIRSGGGSNYLDRTPAFAACLDQDSGAAGRPLLSSLNPESFS